MPKLVPGYSVWFKSNKEKTVEDIDCYPKDVKAIQINFDEVAKLSIYDANVLFCVFENGTPVFDHNAKCMVLDMAPKAVSDRFWEIYEQA